jgi:hypothetical protein
MRYWSLAGADEDFSALLIADGLPPNVANRLYPAVYQADYKIFRSYGIDGVMSWNFMETLDRDQGMMKALAAGAPPDLVVQAWQHKLFLANPQTQVVKDILAGNNPTAAITAGLTAIGVTPVTSSNSGPSQAAVSAYVKNLPPGMLPGEPYDAGGVHYVPDWGDYANASSTATTAVSTTQAAIPATDPYWLFPSGNVENPNTPGPTAGTPAAPVTPPVASVASLATPSNLPWLIAGGAALLLFASKMK